MLGDVTVGRKSELQQLLDVVRSASGGSGRTIFITGFAGMGKSVLVDNFKKAVHDLSSEAHPTLASGDCDPGSGDHDAYEPFKKSCVTWQSQKARKESPS
jgi:predicted ATPase